MIFTFRGKLSVSRLIFLTNIIAGTVRVAVIILLLVIIIITWEGKQERPKMEYGTAMFKAEILSSLRFHIYKDNIIWLCQLNKHTTKPYRDCRPFRTSE